ncbi:hypothetical protein ACOSOMT5_P3104 [Acidiphilium sp. MT5]
MSDANPGSVEMLCRAGEAAMERGDYEAAAAQFNTALALLRAAPEPDGLAIAGVLRFLGQISMETGALEESRAQFTESLQWRRDILGDHHPDVAASLNNLGILAKEIGDFEAARAYHNQALAIRRAILDPHDRFIGLSLTNRGSVARAMGDYGSAMEDHRAAIAIWQRGLGADHPFIAAGRTNLGNVLAEIGDFREAAECHRESLRIRRLTYPPKHPNIANSLHNLGNALIGLADYDAAFECHSEAVAIWREALGSSNADIAAALESLGQIEAARGHHAAAQTYLTDSLLIREQRLGPHHPETGLSLYWLARAARANAQPAAARSFLRDAMRIASLPSGVALRHHVFQTFAELEADAGNSGAAIFFGKQAVNLIQRQRGRLDAVERALQQHYAASNAKIYHHLADQLVREGRLGEAEHVLAMLKEEELFNLLRRDGTADPRMTFLQLTALEARWQSYGDDIIAALAHAATTAAATANTTTVGAPAAQQAVRAAIAAFDEWLDQLCAAFAARSAVDAQDIRRLNQAARAQMQSNLALQDHDTALVHHFAADDRLIILVTTADYQVSRDVGVSRGALHRLIHEFRFAIEHQIEHQTNDFNRIAMTLHSLLIAPIADLLAETGITSLLLAPSGALRTVPFAALHNGTSFLIERFTLTLDTAAARHTAPRGQPQRVPIADWRVAGFGVARAVPGYPQLATIHAELTAIIADPSAPGAQHGIFPGQIHLDAAFTQASLANALQDHCAVHIASHFRFDPAHAQGSHLLLGDGSTLTLADLQSPAFQFGGVSLVALSACETAMPTSIPIGIPIGIIETSDQGADLEGLAALIRRRGAAAVLASLWPVLDDGTPALMTAFYRAIRTGADLAQALRHAQITMITSDDPALRAPVNWAAFVLLGNPTRTPG